MSTAELGCTYASLILHDEGLPVTEDKIKALLDAANVRAEAFWPRLFAKFLAGKNVADFLTASAAPAGGAAPAAAPAAAAPAAAAGGKKEEKKEEKKKVEEEEDADMGFGLFD